MDLAHRSVTSYVLRVPIYLNKDYPGRSHLDREWKHLRKSCELLVERSQAGYDIVNPPNVDHKWGEDTSKHRYERCPKCFTASKRGFAARPFPAWVKEASELDRQFADTHWVYEIRSRRER